MTSYVGKQKRFIINTNESLVYRGRYYIFNEPLRQMTGIAFSYIYGILRLLQLGAKVVTQHLI